MANKNAKELINGIPSCVSGCFENGVDATGCNETDYDCYCYDDNHQTIVDTMEVCLINRARSLGKNCTKDEMFQMENRYWMVCEQYWEPTGTATEPASATMTSKSTTVTAPVFTTKTTSTTSTNRASTAQPDSAAASNPAAAADTGLSVGAQAGIGIGVSLAVILAALAALLWFRERKKRRSLETQLADAHNSINGLAYLAEKKNGGARSQVFEMEGEHMHRQELRGCARTPELNGCPPGVVGGGGGHDDDGISTRYSYGTSTAGSPRPYDAGIGVALRSPHESTRSEATLGSPGSLKPPPLAPRRSRDEES